MADFSLRVDLAFNGSVHTVTVPTDGQEDALQLQDIMQLHLETRKAGNTCEDTVWLHSNDVGPSLSRGCHLIMYKGGFIEMATKRLPQKYLNSVFACETKQASTGAAKLMGVHELDLSIPGGDRSQIPLLLGDNSAVYTVLTRPGAMQTECRHLLKDLHFTRDCI